MSPLSKIRAHDYLEGNYIFQFISFLPNKPDSFHLQFMSDSEYDNTGIYRKHVSEVKVDDFVMFDGHPCVLNSYMDYKNKCNEPKRWFYGTDLLTSQKYDMPVFIQAKVECPIVSFAVYELIGIDFDGFCTLENKEGVLRNDLHLPSEDIKEFVKPLKESYRSGSQISVKVISLLESEAIYGFSIY